MSKVYGRSLLVTLLGVFLISSWLAPSVQSSEESSLYLLAKASAEGDNLPGVLAVEPRALAVANSDAERQGSRLILRLNSGEEKNYQDSSECNDDTKEEKCEQYRLIVHAEEYGVFVVVKALYEDARFILIDDSTGNETVLDAFPIFSPTGVSVLLLNVDDPQHGLAVQIWRRYGNKFVEAWSGAPYAQFTSTSLTTYKLTRWDTEGLIELQAEINDWPSVEDPHRCLKLEEVQTEWRLLKCNNK